LVYELLLPANLSSCSGREREGEGWCEEAGAVVTGASELRAEVFKQGRAPGEAMTTPFLSLQSLCWVWMGTAGAI